MLNTECANGKNVLAVRKTRYIAMQQHSLKGISRLSTVINFLRKSSSFMQRKFLI